MRGSRRQFLLAAAALPLAHLRGSAADDRRSRLGVVQYSYAIRVSADRAAGKTGFNDPLVFVEHCHGLGAGGVQMGIIGVYDKEYLAKLRQRLESYDMYLEVSIRLPKDRADCERFTGAVRYAREAGAKVLRTVLVGGRRYEQFSGIEAFRDAVDRAEQSVKLAEPVVAKQDVLLAIENHKDYRSDELADLCKRLSSRHVGACVDTGNSIALLEEPMQVIETLAP